MSGKPTCEELEKSALDFEQAKFIHNKAEENLRESEKRFSIMFNSSLAAVSLARYDDNRFVDVNQAWQNITGYARSEAVGHTGVELNLWGAPKQRNRIAKMLQERGMARDEVQIRRKSGEIVELLMSAEIIELSGQNYLLSMAQDITDRKKAEEALKESEEKFRNIAENSLVGVYIIQNDHLTYVNTKFAEIFGYSIEECLNHMHFRQLVYPESLEFVEEQIRRRLNGEVERVNYSFKGVKKNGKNIDVEIFGSKILLNGEPAATGIMLDITERVEMEQEYLASLRFFESMDRINRTIQENNDLEQMMSNVLGEVLSILDCDRASLVYPCDPGATSWHAPMERTKPEWPGALALGLEVPMDSDVVRVYKTILASNSPVGFGPDNEHPLPKDVAEQFDEQSQLAMAIYPKVDKPYMFVIHQCSHPRVWTQEDRKLLKEIGRRLEDGLTSLLMHRNLRNEEKKYRSMMEAFVDPLYICSPDFTVEYLNPAMIRRVGRDATGEKCYSALHGLDAKCDWCVFDKVLLGREAETTIQSPLDQKSYRITHMPIRNQNNTISKMTIFRDITDYLLAVSEKEKVQTHLMQAQKMEAIGTLAGGIAHDFNNILASIIGYTELALDDARKGTMLEENLQEVYSAGRRAKDLVKQILSFARQTDEQRNPVQPSRIVKEVLKFIRSTIPTTIAIQQVIESDALIMGDATQIHQVLMNLCTNAAYAMEDTGGTLEVSLKDVVIDKQHALYKMGLRQGDYIRIMVSDTGTGIAPDIIGLIFQPYFTTKSPGEGTGIGLAMVHGIIESYGGKVTVDSHLGQGTTFAIHLPITGKRNAGKSSTPEKLPSGTERILFVDDESTIARMSGQTLERLGYSVTVRTSSIEALELFRAKPDAFDLVITDMTMPNMTGDELAMDLMKIRPDIPVILSTGYSKKISDEDVSEIGIKAFAYKPIGKADLAKIVRNVLDQAKSKN